MAVSTELLEKLASVVDELVDADPSGLGDGETVVALHRECERLGAVQARATATFDASQAWADDGARSTASWVAWQTHCPYPTAQRRVRLGRALRAMPTVEQAWLHGDIGEAQVGLLVRARTPETAELFERDQEMLVEHARDLRFSSFARAISYWRYYADAETCEREAQTKVDSRYFSHSQSFGDMWFSDARFDPIGGSIFNHELSRLEKELFEADWAEAKARVGDGVTVDDLGRTGAQRRADAAVEMAIRSATAPADGKRPEPLLSVLVGYETFAGMMCQLADGTAVTPGSVLPWLSRAWVERVVYDGPSRILDIGVRQRLFTGATRRAVELLFPTCFHPSCEEPADKSDIHHPRRVADGGLTIQDNGLPACAFHHRWLHRRE